MVIGFKAYRIIRIILYLFYHKLYCQYGTQMFEYKINKYEEITLNFIRQKNDFVMSEYGLSVPGTDLVYFLGKCNEIVSKINTPKFIATYDQSLDYPWVSSGSYKYRSACFNSQEIFWKENEMHFKYRCESGEIIDPFKDPDEIDNIYLRFYSNFSEFSKLLTGVYSIEEYYIHCILDKGL